MACLELRCPTCGGKLMYDGPNDTATQVLISCMDCITTFLVDVVQKESEMAVGEKFSASPVGLRVATVR